MRVVLILSTAATFLAHALFGCCWHHVHGAVDAWGSQVSAMSATTAFHCDGCGHSHASPDASDEHDTRIPDHTPHDCDEPWCLYVTMAKAPSIDAPTASWLGLSVDLTPALHAATVAQFDDHPPVARLGADSLRSHLALGVLRI